MRDCQKAEKLHEWERILKLETSQMKNLSDGRGLSDGKDHSNRRGCSIEEITHIESW